MATRTVKTTYALDSETVRNLEDLARRWNVSKSEALRRAIRSSAAQAPPEGLTPIEALDRLQRWLALTTRGAARWAAAVRRERRECSRMDGALRPPVPEYDDFRAVRRLLSASLLRTKRRPAGR